MTRARPLALATAIVIVAGACSASSEARGGDSATFRLAITEPAVIDPYNVQENEGLLVTRHLFEGLLTLDPTSQELRPGVAETWSGDTACGQWTFRLRHRTRFSNGEEVTAASFIRGMTRAAKQSAASDVAANMAGIAGYVELHGTGKPGEQASATTFSGLSAPDAHTLVVILATADCEFPEKTLHPVMSPVPVSAGEAGNRAFRDLPVGNGPFKMEGPWRHDGSVTLVRNDAYHGERPFLERVELTILPVAGGREIEYRGFQTGEFDMARVPPALLPQALARYGESALIAKDAYGVVYLMPNVRNPPLNRPEARRAISLAIDRDAVIGGVFKGFQTKATSLLPPVVGAYHRPGACESCSKVDVPEAKRLAARAGMPPGTKLSLAYNSSGGHDTWVQAVAQQLRDNLGWDVDIDPMPTPELLQRQQADAASGLFRAQWTADYPTAGGILGPLLSTGSGDNRGRYSNPRFDDLLERAGRASSAEARVPLIQEAERIAIGDDVALIPLWYVTQRRVFDAAWDGVDLDFFGNPTLTRIRRR